MANTQTIEIEIPAGTFEVEYSERFETQIRKRFNIPVDQPLDPAFVKLFLEQELRSAIANNINK
jgi:hypothetical protein